MGRDIKFRIWEAAPIKDGFTGIMIDMDYIMQSDYLKDAINGKYPIMQFSGLKDKNGKEIYEGDIVAVKNRKMKAKRNPTYITTVIYKNHGFTLANNDTYFNNDSCINKNIEVIGNIFENPELLTTEL